MPYITRNIGAYKGLVKPGKQGKAYRNSIHNAGVGGSSPPVATKLFSSNFPISQKYPIFIVF